MERVPDGFGEVRPLAYAVAESPDGLDSGLYTVDVILGNSTLIGTTGIAGAVMYGLARDPTSGQLYSTDARGVLYSINDATGAATIIGNTGRGTIDGLDFNGSTLLASTSGDGLLTSLPFMPTIFSINLATAATSNVVTSNVNTGGVRAMAVLNPTTVLVLGDISTNDQYQGLYAINLTTGHTTFIGDLGFRACDAMNVLSDGNLYGLAWHANSYRINPATAKATLLANTGVNYWQDMTERYQRTRRGGTD